jgi:hypothetical protein
MKAFMDFRVNSMSLSGPEIEAIKSGIPLTNKSEQRELEDKKKALGIQ